MAAPSLLSTAVYFIARLIVSTIIIFVVTKLFHEREGIGTAFLAAVVGTIIYTVVDYFLGGVLAAVVGGFVWLLALRHLYTIGWLKAILIAVVVWIVAALVGLLLPTAVGPL